METLRLNALALHLGANVEDLKVSSYDDQIIEHGTKEYLVVTDCEADELWEQDLDNYLEEIIYPTLPDNMSKYFNDEAWKSDARYDGRAHSLARYDGDENEITVYEIDTIDGEIFSTCEICTNSEGEEEYTTSSGTDFYIYRTN